MGINTQTDGFTTQTKYWNNPEDRKNKLLKLGMYEKKTKNHKLIKSYAFIHESGNLDNVLKHQQG